ncbi:MAG: NYN domain-containing protein [Planctomycetota bacterium]
MSLIIDCYNVLHTTMPPMLAGLSEAGLCHALARTTWATAAGGPITVVADGRPKPLGVAESPVAAVDLVYAGSHRSADDLIIDLINAHSAPRRLTVVSSDRVIRAAARRRRARDMASDDFVDKLCHQLRRHGQGPPPTNRPAVSPLPPELVQRWRDAFGFRPDE